MAEDVAVTVRWQLSGEVAYEGCHADVAELRHSLADHFGVDRRRIVLFLQGEKINREDPKLFSRGDHHDLGLVIKVEVDLRLYVLFFGVAAEVRLAHTVMPTNSLADVVREIKENIKVDGHHSEEFDGSLEEDHDDVDLLQCFRFKLRTAVLLPGDQIGLAGRHTVLDTSSLVEEFAAESGELACVLDLDKDHNLYVFSSASDVAKTLKEDRLGTKIEIPDADWVEWAYVEARDHDPSDYTGSSGEEGDV